MHAQTTQTRPAGPALRPGRTAVALLALTAFGCTTVRAPASAIGSAIPVEDGVAQPQVELWLESGKAITPAESARASAEVHAALRQALAQRRADEGDQVLVVRAQGVSRTASRRSDQAAAVAGIVVGAVVVVAAVVIAVVAGQGSGSGGKGGGAKASARPGGSGGGATRPAPPHVGGVAVRPSPPTRGGAPARPTPPGGWAPRPVAHAHHGHSHGHVWIGVGAEYRVPYAPLEVVEDGPLPAPGAQAPWAWTPVPAGPAADEADPADAILLPPLPPLPVDERGFFDGDTTRLELTLVDRATGEPLWVKRVEQGVDPRDARAVRALLDRALDDPKGWAPARGAAR